LGKGANVRDNRKLVAACLLLGLSVISARAEESEQVARETRWQDLEKSLFGDRRAEPAGALVKLEAPDRAEDAALVPMTVRLAEPDKVKELYLVIDDNPSPVAAHFTFGPAADPRSLKLRVRVNTYTNVHAVALMQDGKLVEDMKFVKASGGCSAPMGSSDEEAMQGMGEMRMKFSAAAPASAEAKLMLRHPNFNGMQMNQVTRNYTPARFVDRILVKEGDDLVFDLSTSISLSTDPVLSFGLRPRGDGKVSVEAHDSSNGSWRQAFDLPAPSN
jgi:sulfur-oxidizing protein SoxY